MGKLPTTAIAFWLSWGYLLVYLIGWSETLLPKAALLALGVLFGFVYDRLKGAALAAKVFAQGT